MKNEPNNDAYNYDFLIEGHLPNGIETSIDHRTLSFEGLPMEVGTFKFKVSLIIDPYYPESNVCITYTASQEYIIVVE